MKEGHRGFTPLLGIGARSAQSRSTSHSRRSLWPGRTPSRRAARDPWKEPCRSLIGSGIAPEAPSAGRDGGVATVRRSTACVKHSGADELGGAPAVALW